VEAKIMSSALRIPIDELRKWLEEETVPILEPIKEREATLLGDIRSRLNESGEACERLFEGGEKEMRKGDPKKYRAARAANRLGRNVLERIEKLIVPDKTSHESLQTLCDELERTLASVGLERRRWFPHIEPYFIINRRRFDAAFRKAVESVREIRTFLSQNYSKAKAVEDGFSTIDNFLQSLDELHKVEERKKRNKSRKSLLEKKIAENQQRTMLIQSKREVHELLEINEKIDKLKKKTKYDLRHFRKPFLKLQSLARGAEVHLPLDEAKKLGEYLIDPFEALATEEEDCPLLKRILRKMDDAIVREKLKLKSSRLRKAREQIDNVLQKDALISLHRSCKGAYTQRQQLLTSEAIATFQKELTQLQKELKDLRKRRDFVSSRGAVLENVHKKKLKKIQNQKKGLENTILELTDKNVEVIL